LNENCLKKYQHIGELFDAEGKLVMNQPSMCFLPRHGAQFVKTPILFIQSAYDTWLSASVWMSGKHFGKGKRLSHRNSCTNIGECKDEHVLRQVQLYDWIGRDSLIEFLTESHHSVWRQICVTHGNTNNAMYETIEIGNLKMRDAIWDFVMCNRTIHAIDGFWQVPINDTLVRKCTNSDTAARQALQLPFKKSKPGTCELRPMKTFEFVIKNENKVPEPQQDFVFGSQDSVSKNSVLKNADPKDQLHMLASKIHGSYLTEPPAEPLKPTISTLDAQTLIQAAMQRVNNQVSITPAGIDGAHKIILVLFLFSGMMSIMFLGKCVHGANIKWKASSKFCCL